MRIRSLGWLALLLALCCLPACTRRGIRTEGQIAIASIDDFLRFPGKFSGRVVRLADLRLARATIDRPLVFTPTSPALVEGDDEVVALDGRGLARRSQLVVGESVVIVIDCVEGRSERGNVLVSIERAPPPIVALPSR